MDFEYDERDREHRKELDRDGEERPAHRPPRKLPSPGKVTLTVGLQPRIARDATAGGNASPASDVEALIERARREASGALPDDTRRRLERAANADLSGVRVHTGPAAAAAAGALSANAFALGNDVFFARGRYAPDSSEGQRLIAHEVAHTIQQGATTATVQPQMEVSTPGDAYEREADMFASSIADDSATETASISRGAVPGGRIAQREWNQGDLLPTQEPADRPVRGEEAIRVYHFAPGPNSDEADGDQRILLIGGVHGNERGGIEVVDMILDRLQSGECVPRYEIYVVPILCEANARAEPSARRHPGDPDDGRRESDPAGELDPNRNLPAEGTASDGTNADERDTRRRPITPENRALLHLIDRFEPTRIISVHGTNNENNAGFSRNRQRAGRRASRSERRAARDATRRDDRLVREMAASTRDRGHADSVGGNRNGAVEWGGSTGGGTTLGEWGTAPTADRGAMSVITVETAGKGASVDVADPVARRQELLTLARVIEDFMIAPDDGVGAAREEDDDETVAGRVDRNARGASPGTLGPSAARLVGDARGEAGAPLPPALQAKFEGVLGTDLDAVRVHTGPAASAAADALYARAYCLGDDVFMAAGQHAPSSPDGEHLLAHEVAHSVQQRRGATTAQRAAQVSQPGDPLEREADALADAMVAGRVGNVAPTISATPGGAAIHRVAEERMPQHTRARVQEALEHLHQMPDPLTEEDVAAIEWALTSYSDREFATLVQQIQATGNESRVLRRVQGREMVTTINLTLFHGYPEAEVETQMLTANRVLGRHGLAVREGRRQILDERQSRALLSEEMADPDGARFDEPSIRPPGRRDHPTTDVAAVLENNRTPGQLTAYFVTAFRDSGTTGYAMRRADLLIQNEGVVVRAGASSTTLAHELVHILADQIHEDQDGSDDDGDGLVDEENGDDTPQTNLMTPAPDATSTELTPQQVERIRRSTYTRLHRQRPAADSSPQQTSAGPSTGEPGLGRAVQMKSSDSGRDAATVKTVGAAGVSGAGGHLPYRDRIQESFGAHDVSSIRAHTGDRARRARVEMGAEAYAMGENVSLRPGADLHTVAHEAAHVVQQRQGVSVAGGVGQRGDGYEQHADAVADRVARGQSAEALLSRTPAGGGGASVQMVPLESLPPWLLPILYQVTGESERASMNQSIEDAEQSAVDAALTGAIDNDAPANRGAMRYNLNQRARQDGPDWSAGPQRRAGRDPAPGHAPASVHEADETLTETFQANRVARIRETFGPTATVERVQRAIHFADAIGEGSLAQRIRARLFQVNQYGVIDTLNPEGSPVYQEDAEGQTYCTYYAADVVTALGGYIPRGLNANELNDWFNGVGDYDRDSPDYRGNAAASGWVRIPGSGNSMVQAAQVAADNGNIVVASAAHSGYQSGEDGGGAGHVSVIVAQRVFGDAAPGESVRSQHGSPPAGGRRQPPGADVHNDFRAHTDVVSGGEDRYTPLETNAGTNNFNYGARRGGGTPGAERSRNPQWWANGQHTRGGFWRYSLPSSSPIQADGMHERAPE